jgi:hypothetical protein
LNKLLEFEQIIQKILLKKPEDCTKEDKALLAVEWHNCAESFYYFLEHYVQIQKTPSPNDPNSGGVINFVPPEHVKKYVAYLLSKRFISVLKARQIYISTVTSAYFMWYFLFHDNANIKLFSVGEQEAGELLSKGKRIYNLLPTFLRYPRFVPDNTLEIGIPSMNSRIQAMPATEHATIGETASIIVYDEHAQHPYATENWIIAKPTIDSSGGQVISVFTADPWDNGNFATKLYLDGKAGKNGFATLFFPFNVLPERTEEWYQARMNELSDDDLKGLTRELYMYKNYPRSESESLSSPTTTIAFDKVALDSMKDDTRFMPRIKIEREINDNYINIYQDFHLGNYYIAGSDISEGVGKDYNITVIMNAKTGVVVADILDNTLSPDKFAEQNLALLAVYNNPLWYPEANLWGSAMINVARELGYKHFGYRDVKRTKIGWYTEEKSRMELFGLLIPAINNRQITIPNPKGLEQFYTLIKNADKKGRVEARSGGHDDYPIAVGICWAKKDEVIAPQSYSPLQTLHWNKKTGSEEILERAKLLAREAMNEAHD